MTRFTTACCLLVTCCTASSFEAGVFRQGKLSYRVGVLSPQWQRLHVGDANLAWRHRDGGAIVANAMCQGEINDVPLDVLTNQLFFGIEREADSRQFITIDGREAERTKATGTLDGVAIAVDAVVVKRDSCTFDFQLVGSAAEVSARDDEFTAFFSGFAQLGNP